MERIVYLNGEFVAESEAKVSVFDRGFLFADAVYEVTAVLGGKLIDHQGHLARLERSAKEQPTLVLFTQSRSLINSPKIQTGIKVISFDDIRWRRRDIKSWC